VLRSASAHCPEHVARSGPSALGPFATITARLSSARQWRLIDNLAPARPLTAEAARKTATISKAVPWNDPPPTKALSAGLHELSSGSSRLFYGHRDTPTSEFGTVSRHKLTRRWRSLTCRNLCAHTLLYSRTVSTLKFSLQYSSKERLVEDYRYMPAPPSRRGGQARAREQHLATATSTGQHRAPYCNLRCVDWASR
jgi:hypothetical protein